jgi:calcium-translocating P-type ATPase
MFDNIGSFKGLTNDEVALSREKSGENVVAQKKRKSFLKSLIGNFGDPMIKVLLIALGINVIFLFHNANWFETVGIALAILIANIVSTVSEYGSETAFKKLQQSAANVNCRVRRNGETVVLPLTELVVGDIVLLGAGDKIPADGEILFGGLDVDQSALNGESKDANKKPNQNLNHVLENDTFLNQSKLFAGTVVTGGEAIMRVTEVGANTFYGKLAMEIQEQTPDSPLKVKLEKLAKKISVYGYAGAMLVAFAYLFNGIVIDNKFDAVLILQHLSNWKALAMQLLNAATLAVTVIVMAVPEGLPMMITVVLSSNMRRMLKDNVLIRKLNGIETAGSMNILFTDKTGTLTSGKLDVVNLVLGCGSVFKADDFYENDAEFNKILSASLIFNNGAQTAEGVSVGGNATDRALLSFANKIPSNNNNIKVIKTIPFTSEKKFMSTTIHDSRFTIHDSRHLVKGAPEKILANCTHFYMQNGQVGALASVQKLNRTIEELSQKAMRIVAVATANSEINNDNDLNSLTLVALIGIRDDIRKEAIKGVKDVQSAGIQTVMITGDAKQTAVAIATETGILTKGGLVLSSNELAKMSDNELKEKLPMLRVVARALPSDKSRLVRIAQSLGLVAGMTGDGINDAPALKKADVGFAMGSGTEVAKEAGDVVILDDNINSISHAVSYGRTIFKSIRKFIIFQLTINFCAMAVSIIAPVLNIDTPITVMQMLWINLVMDTLAGLAFGGERPRKKYMQEPPKKRNEPIINRYMWQQIITTSIYAAIVSLWFLTSPLIGSSLQGQSRAYVMTCFFALFMFLAIFNSLNARTHEINLLSYISLNKQFIYIMLGVVAIQTMLIYFGGALFGTQPLHPKHLFLILAIAFTVVPIDLIRKFIMKKRQSLVGT